MAARAAGLGSDRRPTSSPKPRPGLGDERLAADLLATDNGVQLRSWWAAGTTRPTARNILAGQIDTGAEVTGQVG